MGFRRGRRWALTAMVGAALAGVIGTSVVAGSASAATVTPEIAASFQKAHEARGGATGSLGPASGGIVCSLRDSGCYQAFAGGYLLSSASTGINAVPNAVRAVWAGLRYQDGWLGYPAGDQECDAESGACYQPFEHGFVVGTPGTGLFATSDAFWDEWAAWGFDLGDLGLPLGNTNCGLKAGGCYQRYQGGWMFSSTPGGFRVLWDEIRTAWGAVGFENGKLGYPTGDYVCAEDGFSCTQQFEGGQVVDSATGTFAVPAAGLAAWNRNGGADAMGFPTGNLACHLRNGGCYQTFEYGHVLTSTAGGARAVFPFIRDEWARNGFENGRLGYPTTEYTCGLVDGGCWQGFEGGVIIDGPVGLWTVTNAMRGAWGSTGFENGWMGYPVSSTTCSLRNGGCWQQFEGGYVLYSPATGARVLDIPTRDMWGLAGYENGYLGYPTTDKIGGLRGGGSWQGFQGGVMMDPPGVHWPLPMSTRMRNVWGTQGFENGVLGYPTTEEFDSARGRMEHFSGGYIELRPDGTALIRYSNGTSRTVRG
ncbi:LGFP repeat-containing protein [Naasia sp. SYSU D00057]|uniref:LGFP repeat-containing protein n=1 Tax=Naasia sp. SYSU D00057 TaxID=2817380 RepID=UPI001B30BEF3|nr:hypothetical protein [Naasia sp. SYSU D00057]